MTEPGSPIEETEEVPEANGHDSLPGRLSAIEGQPLSDRAVAYAQIHDELTARLEAGDPLRDR